MLRRVAFVRTDISEELSASFIRVTRIGELGTTLAVTSNRRTLRRNGDSGVSPTHLRTERDLDPEACFLMKNALFWDVTPCGSCKSRRFGGT
jgi:hypothetical protein